MKHHLRRARLAAVCWVQGHLLRKPYRYRQACRRCGRWFGAHTVSTDN